MEATVINDYMNKAYELLKADFPAEAYSVDKSRGFALTSLKAQYLVERLNDVLGIHGWEIRGKFEPTENGGMTYIGELLVKFNGEVIHRVEAIGFSDKKKNIGDIFKSARTDALSKASSYLGVGNDMFKGKIEPSSGKKTGGSSKPNTTTTKDSSKKSGGGFTKPNTTTTTTGASDDGWQ